MTAEEMFDGYSEMKKKRQMLSYRISHFTGISPEEVIQAMAFSHPCEDVRVQTSGTSDKTARIAENYQKIVARENDDYYQFLLDEYERLDEEICFIDGAVKGLGSRSSIVFEILDRDMTWDQIADAYHVSRSTVSRYRKAAIAEIREQCKYREQSDLQYILS